MKRTSYDGRDAGWASHHPPAKKVRVDQVIDLVNVPDEANPALSMPYWARNLYNDSKLPYIGKLNLEKLFMKREWVGKSCGMSGYRLFHATKASIQLRGADNNLARIAWSAERSSAKTRNTTPGVELDDGRSYFGRDGGRRRGEDIHREIEEFCKLPPVQFNAAHPQVDPLTKAVLDRLKAMRLRAIAGEFVVHDMASQSGTGIDIICMNTEGHIEVVELKTGYVGSNFIEIDENTLSMRAPFSNIKDTPLNRARMQLLYGSILLQNSHGINAVQHWVIHATPDTNSAIAHELGDAVLAQRATLLSAIRFERDVDTAVKQSRSEYKKQQKKGRVGTTSSKAMAAKKDSKSGRRADSVRVTILV